jgi:single-strand DNA-binding protein
MPNHAQATIMGHLGKDPDVRVSKAGKEITSFSIAVNTGYGDNKKATWWNVTCFGKTGEVAAKYLEKGLPVLVTGEPYLDTWEDDDGVTRQTLKLTADRLVLLGSRDEQDAPRKEAKPAPKKASEDAPFDDEIPF